MNNKSDYENVFRNVICALHKRLLSSDEALSLMTMLVGLHSLQKHNQTHRKYLQNEITLTFWNLFCVRLQKR